MSDIKNSINDLNSRITRKKSSNTWFNNAVKSAGIATGSIIKEISPTTYTLGTTAGKVAKSVATNVKNANTVGKKATDTVRANKYVKFGETYLKNALEDLKAGKFVNEDRMESAYDESMEDMLGGSVEDLFDDFSIDFDDELSDEEGPDIVVNQNAINPGENASIPVLADIGEAINAQSRHVLNVGKFNTDAMAAISTMQMNQTATIGNDILSSLGALNENLASLVQYQSENVTAFMESTLEFFRQKSMPEDDYSGNSGNLDVASIFSDGFNVENYGKLVLQNLNKTYRDSMVGTMGEMLMDFSEMFTANPLAPLSEMLVKSLIPKVLAKSMKKFDETLTEAIPTILSRVSDLSDSEDLFKSTIGKLFGIRDKRIKSFDLTRALDNKEVPFDKITKHSIVEVIPTYLRKMLSALTNEDELVYDQQYGRLEKKEDVKSDLYSNINDAVLSQFMYGDFADAMNQRSERLIDDDKEKFDKLLERFFFQLEKKQIEFNPINNGVDNEISALFPTLRSGKNELEETFGNGLVKFFKASIDSLNREDIMSLSSSRIKATRDRNDIIKNYNDDPDYYNTFLLNQDPGGIDNEIVSRFHNTFKNGKRIVHEDNEGTKARIVTSAEKTKDLYTTKVIDGISDIRMLLNRGINVNIIKGKGFEPRNFGDPTSGAVRAEIRDREPALPHDNDSTDPKPKEHKGLLARFKRKPKIEPNGMRLEEFDEYRDNYSPIPIVNKAKKKIARAKDKYISPVTSRSYNPDGLSLQELEERRLDGRYTRSIIDGDGVDNIQQHELATELRNFANPPDPFEGMFDDVSLERGTSPSGRFRRRVEPAARVASHGIDNTRTMLMDFIYGSPDQFTANIVESTVDVLVYAKDKINDNFIKPLKETLFGTKNEDGYVEGGITGGFQNSVRDTFLSFRQTITGKGYVNSKGEDVADITDDKGSVWGNIKSVFNTIKNSTSEYLFGKGEKNLDENGNVIDKEKMGILATAGASILGGFAHFSNLLFGKESGDTPEEQAKFDKETLEDAKKIIKERAPRTIAGGLFGAGVGFTLGGSLLGTLVGGPVAGALIGSSVSWLSQSEKFKEKVFGKTDEITGEHIDGFISKKTQDFISKNKGSMIGGATLGALKTSIFGSSLLGGGLLGSIVGGPVAGALMGTGFALAKESKVFQEFLYGKGTEGEAGYKKGVMTSVKAALTNSDNQNKLGIGTAGAIAGGGLSALVGHMGVMGAMLTPGGPILGAIIGAGLGIASASDKFKDFLFGTKGEDNIRDKDEGALGKLGNFMEKEVLTPVKLTVQRSMHDIKWFMSENILEPVRDALDPIIYQFGLFKDIAKEKIVGMFDGVKEGIVNAFIEPIRLHIEPVFKSFKGFMTNMLQKVGKLFGNIIAAPFKLLLAPMTAALAKSHENKLIDERANEIREKMKKQGVDDTRSFTERMSTGIKETRELRTKEGRQKVLDESDSYLQSDEDGNGYLQRREARKAQLAEKRYGEEREVNKREDLFSYEQSQAYMERIRGKMLRDEELETATPRERKRHAVYAKQLKKEERKLTSQATHQMSTYGEMLDGSDPSDINPTLARMYRNSDRGREERDQEKAERKAERDNRKAEKKQAREERRAARRGEEVAAETTENQDVEVTTPASEPSTQAEIVTPVSQPATPEQLAEIHANAQQSNTQAEVVTPVTEQHTPEQLAEIHANTQAEIVTPVSQTATPEQLAEIHANAQTDNQEATEPRVKTKAKASAKLKGPSNNEANTAVLNTAKDVSVIKDEVRGQLNGVGSNLSKIRRILNKKLGTSETDEAGEDTNNEYVSFKDKLLNMLDTPFRSLIKIIKFPIVGLGKLVTSAGNAIKSIGTFFWELPGKAVKTVASVVGGVATFAKETIGGFLSGIGTFVLEGSKAIGRGLVNVVSTTGHLLIQGGQAVLSGVGNAIGGIASGIGSAIGGITKGVGYLLTNIPVAIGNIAEAGGKLFASIGNIIAASARAVWDTTKLVGDVVGTILAGLLKGVKAVGKGIIGTVGNIGGSIIGKIGSIFKSKDPDKNKLKTFSGGWIDKIVDPVKVETKDKPLDVFIVGTKDDVPVTLHGGLFGSESSAEGEDKPKSNAKKVILNLFQNVAASLAGIYLSVKGIEAYNNWKADRESGASTGIMNIVDAGDLPDNAANINPDSNVQNMSNDTVAPPVTPIVGASTELSSPFVPASIVSLTTNAATPNSAEPVDPNTGATLQEEHDRAELNQEAISSRTARAMIEERSAEAEISGDNERDEERNELLSHLTTEESEHNKEWSSIFGKKGLITAGILLAVPLLLKFFKSGVGESVLSIIRKISEFLKNMGKDAEYGSKNLGDGDTPGEVATKYLNGEKEILDPVIVDEDGNLTTDHKSQASANVMAHGPQYANKLLHSKFGQSVINKGTQIYDAGVGALRSVRNVGSSLVHSAPVTQITDMARLNMGVAGEMFNQNHPQLGGMVNGARGAVQTGANAAMSGIRTGADSIRGMSRTALDSARLAENVRLATVVAEAPATRAGTREATRAANALVDGSSESTKKIVAGYIKKFGELLATKLAEKGTALGASAHLINEGTFKPIIQKMLLALEKAFFKYSARLTRTLLKVAADMSTLFLSEVAFVTFGSLSGLTGASNLFQIRPDKVDAKMIAISTVLGGFAGTSIGSIIDIVNEMVVDVFGIDGIHELAMFAYMVVANDENEKKLQAATEDFKKDYDDYVGAEYLTQLKEFNLANGTDITMDEFKTMEAENKVKVERISFADYNNKENKDLWTKTVDTFNYGKQALGNAWEGVKNTIGGGASVGFDIMTNFGNKMLDGAKAGVGGMKATFDMYGQSSLNNYKDESGNIVDPLKILRDQMFNAIKGPYEDITKSLEENKGNILKTMDGYMGKMFGFEDDKGQSMSLSKAIDTKWGVSKGIHDAKQKLVDGMNGALTSLVGATSKFWNDIKNNANSIKNTIDENIGNMLGLTDKQGNRITATQAMSNTWNKFTSSFRVYPQSGSASDYGSGDSCKTSKCEDSGAMYDDLKMGLSNQNVKATADSYPAVINGAAYYHQQDKEWANTALGDKTIGDVGCIVSALSMAASSLSNTRYTPNDVMNKYGKNGGFNGSSINWNVTVPGVANDLGIKVGENISTAEQLKHSLKKHIPVVMFGNKSGNGNIYGKGGNTHAVLATGLDTSGNVIFNDPGNLKRTINGGMNKVWADSALKGTKRAFAMTQADGSGIKGPLTLGGQYVGKDPNGNADYSEVDRIRNKRTFSGTLDWMTSIIGEFGRRSVNAMFMGDTLNTDYSDFEYYTDEMKASDLARAEASVAGVNPDGTATMFDGLPPPANITDELLNKTIQMTILGESKGDYSAVTPNDNGAYSVGLYQAHKGKAKTFFDTIAGQLPDNLAKQARKYANMSSKALTNKEAEEMKVFLNNPKVYGVSKAFQDNEIINQAKANMEVPLDMLSTGEIKDPRSVVLASDIANTGNGHMAPWRKKHTPAATKEVDLVTVKDSLKSKNSYWGADTGKYHNGWMNRIDRAFSELAGWAPQFDGNVPIMSGYDYQPTYTEQSTTEANYTLQTNAAPSNTQIDPTIPGIMNGLKHPGSSPKVPKPPAAKPVYNNNKPLSTNILSNMGPQHGSAEDDSLQAKITTFDGLIDDTNSGLDFGASDSNTSSIGKISSSVSNDVSNEGENLKVFSTETPAERESRMRRIAIKQDNTTTVTPKPYDDSFLESYNIDNKMRDNEIENNRLGEFFNKVINLLGGIAENTGLAATKLDGINANTSTIIASGGSKGNTNINVKQAGNTAPSYQNNISSSEKIARLIARGGMA